MLLFLPCLASMICILDGCMLICHAMLCSECIELVNMPTRYLICMLQFFTKSVICLCFCHVHMLGIVCSDPFWLKVTKGLLSRSLSSSMLCFTLSCSGPVACSFVAPKRAT